MFLYFLGFSIIHTTVKAVTFIFTKSLGEYHFIFNFLPCKLSIWLYNMTQAIFIHVACMSYLLPVRWITMLFIFYLPGQKNTRLRQNRRKKTYQKKIPCLHYALCVKRGKFYYNPIFQYNPNNIIVRQKI